MLKEATVMAVDLMGFNKRTQTEDPCMTARFLCQYYRSVGESAASRGWRFVKGIGDCILLEAQGTVEPEVIHHFFKEVSAEYPIAMLYRTCKFVQQQIDINGYSCLDIVGKDICNLFLRDDYTTKIG